MPGLRSVRFPGGGRRSDPVAIASPPHLGALPAGEEEARGTDPRGLRCEYPVVFSTWVKHYMSYGLFGTTDDDAIRCDTIQPTPD